MLRCSSFTQVKCNWYRMRATPLTVKKNNSKTPLPEAVSMFILQKKLIHIYNYKSTGETPSKSHLLQ